MQNILFFIRGFIFSNGCYQLYFLILYAKKGNLKADVSVYTDRLSTVLAE